MEIKMIVKVKNIIKMEIKMILIVIIIKMIVIVKKIIKMEIKMILIVIIL